MAKKLAYVTCRLDPESRAAIQCRADLHSVTVSTYARSVLVNDALCQRVSRDTVAGKLLDCAERFYQVAQVAAQDGVIDAVECGKLTRIEAESLGYLWPPEAA